MKSQFIYIYIYVCMYVLHYMVISFWFLFGKIRVNYIHELGLRSPAEKLQKPTESSAFLMGMRR